MTSNILTLNRSTIHLLPGDTMELHELPLRGVALDGCIRGPHATARDQWSFDHHDNCIRMITLSTCEQVRAALCLGGPSWFNGRDVYVNDLDGDTLLSLWLIANPKLANAPHVRDLVRAVGAIDAHGPSGSLLLDARENDTATLFYRAAIQPVTALRGAVREVFDKWPDLIADCLMRIGLLLEGSLDPLEETEDPPLQVERAIGNKLIATCDGFGFSQAYALGYEVVVLHKPAADGSTTYTIAKRSDLVNWPVGPSSDPNTILGRLNALELGWGGGSSIGGSPRLPEGVSSRLTPDQVWAVVLGWGVADGA